MNWREVLGLAPSLGNKTTEIERDLDEPKEPKEAEEAEETPKNSGPVTMKDKVLHTLDNPVPAPSSDPDWIIVKHHIRERLIAQRRALEVRGTSLSETEGHRHAIFELEGVLNCLNPSKMQSGPSE